MDHDMPNAPERRLRGSMRSMHAQRMGADLTRIFHASTTVLPNWGSSAVVEA